MTSTFLLFQIYKHPTNELIVIITQANIKVKCWSSQETPLVLDQQAFVKNLCVLSQGGINKLNSTPSTEVQVIDEDVDSVDAVVIAAK